jgi:hypothetical protein
MFAVFRRGELRDATIKEKGGLLSEATQQL